MAQGRHWQLALDRVECSDSQVALGAAIRFLGPKGLVEAPLIRLVDGGGRRMAPRSLVWKRGTKAIAEWLSGGGVTNLQSADIGEAQIRFELREAAGDLRLEFGDIAALELTRKRKAGCDGLLQAAQIHVAAPQAQGAPAGMRIYRGTYPCAGSAHPVEAQYPPYPPKHLIVLGRGYLPNAREIALPMGTAPAQSYAYSGRDDLDAVEQAARRYLSIAPRQFAFNWGTQRMPGGNEAYAIGVYELRACAK